MDNSSYSSIEELIVRIIKERLIDRKVNVPDINVNTRFVDIDYSSLDVMETIIEAEGVTKKVIDNNWINDLKTVNDICDLFKGKKKEKNRRK